MAPVSFEQIAHDLTQQHRHSKEKNLIRGIHTDDIPIEELAVLCKYTSCAFVAAMFGGKAHPLNLKINKYFNELAEQQKTDDLDKRQSFVEKEPAGIGGWRYANRLQQKVFKELESVINQGTSGTGQQLVHASKLLIAELTKVKESSMELMEAYEKQIIIIAEFIVEKFLPNLGRQLKNEMRDDIEELFAEAREKNNLNTAMEFLQVGLDKMVRKWDIKRYELLFAELLADDQETSQAFNFTSDMVDEFLDEKYVSLADEAALVIQRATEKGR